MSGEPQLDPSLLHSKTVPELKAIASAVGAAVSGRSTKSEVISTILAQTGGGGGATNAESSGSGRGRRSAKTEGEKSETVTSQSEAQTGKTEEKPSGGTSDAPGDSASQSGGGSGGGNSGSNNSGSNNSGRNRNDRQRNGRGFDNYAADGNTGGNSRSSRRRRGRRGRDRGEGGANYESRVEQAAAQFDGEPEPVRGILDLRDEGFGFVRTKGYLPHGGDVYVPVSLARKYHVRKGDTIEGTCRPASSNEKYPAMLAIEKVAGHDPEVAKLRPKFEDLTPLFPDEKLRLELAEDPLNMTARIIDLMSPIGKGQRGLLVSPPKAGKTTVVKQIVRSIEANNPEVHLMVLLIDERPEEVTDMRRLVKRGEVVASTFDRPADEHTKVAELAIERAKRLVEQQVDVVIILDGITRLARAYNLAAPATGRIMSGGVDSAALYPPKKFFGAARNIEEGGSLTILATALVETGSKMDEVIFEEFKGTGNMELRLDRRLAERRLYPAIDANGSSTRHEELLYPREQLNQVWKLRRVLNGLAQDGNTAAGLELLMDKMKSTRNNDEFLAEIAKNPNPGS